MIAAWNTALMHDDQGHPFNACQVQSKKPIIARLQLAKCMLLLQIQAITAARKHPNMPFCFGVSKETKTDFFFSTFSQHNQTFHSVLFLSGIIENKSRQFLVCINSSPGGSTLKHRISTFEVTLSSLLVALMLILGYVESTLPALGIPGIKLGLSNGILIFAVYMLNIPLAYVLMIMKITLSSLLFSGFQTFPYAFAGGLLSLTVMSLTSKSKSFSPVAVSILGGITHNIGQVLMAIIIAHLPLKQMLYYMGILIIVGMVCGALTGYIADRVMKHLKSSRVKLPKVKKKSGLILQIVSVLLVLACIYFTYQSARNTANTVIVTVNNAQNTQSPAQLPDNSN